MLTTQSVSASSFDESDVKAAFLYYFVHFISWPDNDSENEDRPLQICALNASPVSQSLELILASPKAANTSAELRLISDPAEAITCNYVYLPSEQDAFKALVIEATKGRPILTVSDSENFARDGGMIELKRAKDSIKVLVNLGVLNSHQFKGSSKLLRLAQIITTSDSLGENDVAIQ